VRLLTARSNSNNSSSNSGGSSSSSGSIRKSSAYIMSAMRKESSWQWFQCVLYAIYSMSQTSISTVVAAVVADSNGSRPL
jgi:hypothetical protein